MPSECQTIGVLGGGQLGRMLALAGYPLGLKFRFYDTTPDAPAGQVGELVVGAWDDRAALERFTRGLDVVTYEFENVPVGAAKAIAERVTVYPPPLALEVGQDRLREKTLFREIGLAVPDFEAVATRDELADAVKRLGTPVVAKTRRGGYDGKGQAVIRDESEVGGAWESLQGRPLLVETLVPFERELSMLAARGPDGAMSVYPPVLNEHRAGILRTSRAPAPGVPGETCRAAESHMRAVMERLGYVGVLAIEFFEVRGELLANELAPRVHNSGHWTIEGAVTSQFENHVRAVAGLPLGDASARGRSVMVNLIGAAPSTRDVLAVPGAELHLYGKEPRRGRKIGHVTVCGEDTGAVEAAAARVIDLAEEAAR